MVAVEFGGTAFEFDPVAMDDWRTYRLVAEADRTGAPADVVALFDHVMGGQADAVAAALADESGRTSLASMREAFDAVCRASGAPEAKK